jgi:hypothetical protein
MGISNYTDLKVSMANWLARDDLTSYLDDFIDLAEERLSRDLRLRATEATMNVTLVSGLAAIPADYVQMKHVHIAGDPVQPLEVKESTWILDQFPTRSADSKPRYLAEDGGNFIFGPFPSAGPWVLGGQYWKKPAALTTAAPTNEWTDNVPDVLLWACLCESAPFLKDDQRTLLWEEKYDRAKDRVMTSEKKRTRKGSRIALDPGISTHRLY